MAPVLPDLLPATSWGSSLANLLTKTSWDALRLPAIKAAGHACQLCNVRTGILECHEIWAYSLPPPTAPEGALGVQRLLGLAALCRSCHALFHMDYARMTGSFDAVNARLMDVNQWSEAEFAAYDADQERKGHLRSTRCWILDLSLVGGGAPLAINGRWSLAENGSLTGPIGPSGRPAFTVLLGVSYVISGRLMPVLDPGAAMDGLLPAEGDFAFAARVRGEMPDAAEQETCSEPLTSATTSPIADSPKAAEDFLQRAPELEGQQAPPPPETEDPVGAFSSIPAIPAEAAESDVTEQFAHLRAGARLAPVRADPPKKGFFRRWFAG
jgi:hypothetical protein